jgi:hypothetical protein
VVAPRAKSRAEAGGNKACPYAPRFPFNFEDAHDQDLLAGLYLTYRNVI